MPTAPGGRKMNPWVYFDSFPHWRRSWKNTPGKANVIQKKET